MKDGKQIIIRSLSGAPKTWLCLQGTILSFHERFWCRQRKVDIPLELISFTEKKQFKGSRLIAALLSLLILPGIGGAVIGLWYLINRSVPDTVIAICMATGANAGLILFLIFLIRFFIRQKTIWIHIAPENAEISFWLNKKNEQEIRDLTHEIQVRKSVVEETIPYPMTYAFSDTIDSPWRRTVVLTFIFSVPAIITEIPWLLLACVIPIGMYIHSTIVLFRQPALYRQAERHFLKREWEQALNAIKDLIRREPEFLPARMFHIELLMRVDDFSGAATALSDIQDVLDAKTVQDIQHDIIIRERMEERKKADIQPDKRGNCD